MPIQRTAFGRWWKLGSFLVVLVTVSAVLVVVARRQWDRDADHIDCATNKCIALTFDDGPSPFTDRLLRVLAARGAKATFFLIGNKVWFPRDRGGFLMPLPA
ncbi:polysaccharide deacetylase family protein [Mycolicibacterium mucogenicum]|uniref:polysaccharide deacetylase family protein n=1 Tax=Mycolicibacterium mucogenicum TaxID=56689 RepID=UPI003977CEB3